MDGQKGHQTSMKDEQLQEQYEDALFALLMDELAKRQGAEYSRENEALKQDAAFAVPERTYQRCLHVIRRGFAGRRFKKAGKIALLAIRKLSVAVFTLLVLFGAAIAASPRLQSSTLRFLMYFDAKGTTIEARPEENAAYAPDGTLKVQVGWIPDGFALTEEWEAEIGFEYTYRSADDRCVYVNVSGGVGTASIDSFIVQRKFHEVCQGDRKSIRLGIPQTDGQAGLRIAVHQQYSFSFTRQVYPQIDTACCFPCTAFLINDPDNACCAHYQSPFMISRFSAAATA